MTNKDEKQPQSDYWCETDFRAWKTSKGTFIWKIAGFVDHREDKSYDDSVKLKRTEMDPFRLG